MPDYLAHHTINDLTNALMSAGLAVPDTRNELLTGITSVMLPHYRCAPTL